MSTITVKGETYELLTGAKGGKYYVKDGKKVYVKESRKITRTSKRGNILKQYKAHITIKGKPTKEETYTAYNSADALEYWTNNYPDAEVKIFDWQLA